MNKLDNKKKIQSAYQTLRVLLTTEEIFHIFAVTIDDRPACLASVVIQKETNQPFCESPKRPEITGGEAKETVSNVLESLNLSYKTYEKEDEHREIINYFISNNTKRVTELDETTKDDIEIGVFLGYPTEAIDWYVTKTKRISDLKEWYLKFTAVDSHNQQPYMVQKFNYIEYIPAPREQSYKTAFKIADTRNILAKRLDKLCDTNAFTSIKHTNQRKPVEYGVLYAFYRLLFEQNVDRN